MRELGEKNMRAGQLFFHTTRSDCGSSRSYHAFGLPKLHRCFECVGVTVRVFRSEDLKKNSLPSPSFRTPHTQTEQSPDAASVLRVHERECTGRPI